MNTLTFELPTTADYFLNWLKKETRWLDLERLHIYFDVTSLDDDRLKVSAGCTLPAAREYFHDLLIAIAGDWPKAEKTIVAYLDAADKIDPYVLQFTSPERAFVREGCEIDPDFLQRALAPNEGKKTEIPLRRDALVAPQPAQAVGNGKPKPWEEIPDHLWDRRALELWWAGNSCPEIGKRIGQAEKTVRNRLTELRNTHSESVVPTDKLRREKLG